MNKVIPVLALLSPVLQAALMGFIGYPIARRRPGGMDAFHRSGFAWWLITIGVIIVAGGVANPGLFSPSSPSVHELTVARVLVTGAVGLAAVCAIEIVVFIVSTARRRGTGKDRYDEALPAWGRGPLSEPLLLAGLAAGEEAVYRALALGGLLFVWGASKPVAAGVVAAAFGLAHWYYGPKQVALKSLVGAVLCAVAMSAGWVVAAAVHVSLNLVLVALNRSRFVAAGVRETDVPTGSTS